MMKKVVKIKDLLLYALLCIILVTMKLPYVLLVGLLLFIPRKKTQCKNYYLVSLALIIVVFLFTIFWYVLTQQVRIENFKLEGADVKGQIISIISKPHWYLPVILKEMLLSVSHLNQLYTFGWLDLSMSEVLIPIYALYTLITFFKFWEDQASESISSRSKFGFFCNCWVNHFNLVSNLDTSRKF